MECKGCGGAVKFQLTISPLEITIFQLRQIFRAYIEIINTRHTFLILILNFST